MCYALPVMLRGSCSCAISERPTPSPFALSSLFRMLSPIIPVHPRNAPVSPIIPVHTQKQGGGGVIRMVTYLKYVGAPTFLVGARRLRHSDERSLQGLKPALLAADCRT